MTAHDEARKPTPETLGKFIDLNPQLPGWVRSTLIEHKDAWDALLKDYDAQASELSALWGHHEVQTVMQAKQIEALERADSLLREAHDNAAKVYSMRWWTRVRNHYEIAALAKGEPE